MPQGIFPNEGELEVATYFKNAIDVKLILVKSSATLDSNSDYNDATTNKANFSGYADIALDGTDFGNPTTDGNNKAELKASAYHDFTHNGGGTANTIKYYAVIDETAQKLIAFQELDATQLMESNGDRISIKPIFKFVTESGN